MGKQVITINDLREMFQVSYAKACSIMRGIKSVSDIAGLKGKVMIQDYEKWLEVKR